MSIQNQGVLDKVSSTGFDVVLIPFISKVEEFVTTEWNNHIGNLIELAMTRLGFECVELRVTHNWCQVDENDEVGIFCRIRYFNADEMELCFDGNVFDREITVRRPNPDHYQGSLHKVTIDLSNIIILDDIIEKEFLSIPSKALTLVK